MIHRRRTSKRTASRSNRKGGGPTLGWDYEERGRDRKQAGWSRLVKGAG